MRCERYPLHDDRKDVTLTTYLWDDSRELTGGKKRPAILICPGGGYFTCSDQESEPVALRFAGLGYHTFVLRYATYTEGGPFPDISKPIPVKERDLHPAPLRDVGDAMRFICAHAEAWQVDTERIAVCGFSAGGHNAAMYATRWQEDPANPRPAAAILGYALTDYVFKSAYESRQDPGSQAFFHASDTAFLGTPTPTAAQLEDVSPDSGGPACPGAAYPPDGRGPCGGKGALRGACLRAGQPRAQPCRPGKRRGPEPVQCRRGGLGGACGQVAPQALCPEAAGEDRPGADARKRRNPERRRLTQATPAACLYCSSNQFFLREQFSYRTKNQRRMAQYLPEGASDPARG